MLKHKREIPSPDRLSYLQNGYLRFDTDGLNSLVYEEIAITSLDLYTSVRVDV